MSTAAKGRFVWYDLMTTDPDAAIIFYAKIFGWDLQPIEGSEMSYNVVVNKGVAIGGISLIPQEAVDGGVPPYWMGYISAPELDETVGAAKESGSEILVPPTDVPGMGAFSVIQDPQGAVVAFYREDKAPEGRTDTPRTGDVDWHELETTDWKAATDFYTKLADWEDAGAEDMSPMGTYQMFVGGGISRGGVYNKPVENEGSPEWLLYFLVEDVKASVEEIKDLGGQVLNGPMEVPGGDIVAVCRDPQGAKFAVHAKTG